MNGCILQGGRLVARGRAKLGAFFFDGGESKSKRTIRIPWQQQEEACCQGFKTTRQIGNYCK